MGPHVIAATQHLLRYLKRQQESGLQRAYLTEEARATLRQLYHRTRGSRVRVQSAPTPAVPAQAPAPATPAPSPPPEPAKADPPIPAAEVASPPAESAYPAARVAAVRTAITPSGATKDEQLMDLKQQIAKDAAAHLPTLRDTMVFSTGNLNAELMFIGEAPGNEEERQQEPFVGPAGQLLNKIIQAMGLQREMVYISNIVKYRPAMPNQGTGNRKPDGGEMTACLPYIVAEIDLVRPKAIVALGATAAEGLTGETTPVGRARGRVRSWNGTPFVVTYHPSYLLHNGALSERRKVWEDMLLVMETLQMPVSQKQRQFFTKGR